MPQLKAELGSKKEDFLEKIFLFLNSSNNTAKNKRTSNNSNLSKKTSWVF
jgi:hypothetical protein